MNLLIFRYQWTLVDSPRYGYARLPVKARAKLFNVCAIPSSGRANLPAEDVDAMRRNYRHPLQDGRPFLPIGRRVFVAPTRLDLVPKRCACAQLTTVAKGLSAPVDWISGMSRNDGVDFDEISKRFDDSPQDHDEAAR